MVEERVLTVRQPWAEAIAVGAKPVENRTLRTKFRGRLWVHAGKGWSERGRRDQRVLDAFGDRAEPYSRRLRAPYLHALRHVPAYYKRPPHPFQSSAILASAELVDCHPANGCCEPWGEEEYVQADGRRRTDIWHWVLDDIHQLDRPIPAAGRLGLWRPDPDLTHELQRVAIAVE